MSDEMNGFAESRPLSRKLYEEAVSCMAGGVAHESRYVAPFPIYIDRAKGSRKWDVDGHEYIDYSMGSASLLLGHAHPDVVAAIAEQAPRGTYYGNCHPLEVEWAGLVQRLVPSAELVRFVGSGTESTLLAFRVARAYSGKKKIIRFEGHYHGWHDHVAPGMQPPFAEVPTLGLLPGIVEAMIVLPANDPGRVEAELRKDGDIAAVIVEASGGSWGTVPLVPGFHAELRRIADAHGVLLIFDEVITGFRHSPGGVQALVGVTPDLTTLAKVLTGGLPGGAVAGRAEVMRVLDPRTEFRGKRPGAIHRGTFNANPLAAAAGVAALKVVATGEPQRHANAIAARVRTGMQAALERHRVAGVVYGDASTWHVYFGRAGNGTVEGLSAAELKGIPKKTVAGFQQALRARGVDPMSYTGGVTSLAHTDDDVRQTIEAFDGAIGELLAAGLVERR
jgi:glutamate-1-semialdehyde 2,1-aminomutase